MKRTLLSGSTVVTVSIVAMVLGTAAAQGGSSAAACTSGPTTYQGARGYVGCGPATALVKLGGRTLRYRGGTCRRTAQALELNIGTTVLEDTSKPLPPYFGVAVGRIFGVGTPAPRDGRLPKRDARACRRRQAARLAGGATRPPRRPHARLVHRPPARWAIGRRQLQVLLTSQDPVSRRPGIARPSCPMRRAACR
jgi:hypothetical protein